MNEDDVLPLPPLLQLRPADWIWGIDVHTAHVAISAIKGDAAALAEPIRTRQAARTTERLSDIYGRVYVAARRFALRCPPLMIWVEQPVGQFPAPTLMASWGVVRCALYDAFATVGEAPVSVHVLDVRSWKKLAFGTGRFSKEEAIAWALEQYDLELDEHQAESLGIARAGRSLLQVPAAVAA